MLDFLQRLLATYGYEVVAFVILAEGAGIPLPGETILLLAGAWAGAGNLDLRGVILAAALGAIAGDNLGYAIGRKGGRALLERYGHLFRLGPGYLQRAEEFYARHGTKTVFLARFVAILRTFSSLLAGANRMPYPRFVVWNAAGGALWAVVIGVLGSVFGSQWQRLAHWIGRAGLVLVLVVAGILLFMTLRRRLAASGGAAPFLRARLTPGSYHGLPLTAGVVLFALATAACAGIGAYVVRNGPVPNLDATLLARLPSLTSLTAEPGTVVGWRDVLLSAPSVVGRPVVLLLASFGIALVFLRRRQGSDALLVALAVGGADAVNPLVKLFFERPRPPLAELASYSFPSAHATVSLAFFGIVAYSVFRARGRWGRTVAVTVLGLLAIAAIGVSRVAVHDHYPTDVLGGWATGAAWLALVITVLETWRRHRLALLGSLPPDPDPGVS
jgi:membrane protein DedA with SNARE-associated domain/membrane-associated phospholipid phosphatase